MKDRADTFRFDIVPMGAVRTTRRQMYKDDSAKRYHAYKQHLKHVLQQQYGITQAPARSAIGIPKITFYMPIPKDGKREMMVDGKKKRVPVTEGDWHTSRPDTDNLEKAVFDVFNGLYWHDDSQVCHIGEVKKVYSATPGIEIEVVELY